MEKHHKESEAKLEEKEEDERISKKFGHRAELPEEHSIDFGTSYL